MLFFDLYVLLSVFCSCVLLCVFCSVFFLFSFFMRAITVLSVLYRMCFPVRPSAPTITTCSPNGTVPANTAVSCTCTTSSVGQPQGRLKWVKVADGSQISVGGYGSTTLQMTPRTLTLNEHGVVKFRCDVDWVVNVTGEHFRASVACE